MNPEVLITLFKYYAQFVPKPVLKKMFVKSRKRLAGYGEISAEVLAAPGELIIPDIDAFIFSANEDFLTKKMKNTKGTVLYVEYGAFSYSPNKSLGVREKLALHVAYPYSATNNDNLNEMLLMDKMYKVLTSILDQMEKDQRSENFCGNSKLIEFPAEVVVIDPAMFHGRTGWMAIFDYSTTNIVR
ncbi:MAG: hypothetical protein E6767_19340 [Dysgonomonas sp.]|nr:hypothetical protein [Dysgonomonas sp.]